MSNFPDAHKVYDLAAVFRERVIEQGRSFLWPDQDIWTVENAEAAYQWYLENLNPKTFHVGSVGEKGREHSVITAMIAADCYALSLLTPAYTKQVVDLRLGGYFNQPDVPSPDQETLGRIYEAIPIAVPGTMFHYSGNWPHRITAVIGMCLALRDNHITTRSSYEDIRQSLEGHDMVGRDLHSHGVMEVLQLLYPEEIPVTAGVGATQLIIQKFQRYLGALKGASDNQAIRSVVDNDRLKAIHSSVAPGIAFTESALFNPEVIAAWAPNPAYAQKFQNQNQSSHGVSVSHVVTEKARIYEIAELFQDQVIEQKRSLLWPSKSVWTDEAIERFLRDFQSLPVVKGQSWLQNFQSHLAKGNPDSPRILADSYAFLMQFPSIGTITAASKLSAFQTIINWAPDVMPDESVLALVANAFGLGVGRPGRYFSNNVQYQLAFVPAFVREYRSNPERDLFKAVTVTARKLKDDYGFDKSVVPAQNIILHLFDPIHYERIASRADKTQIVEAFNALIDDLDLDPDGDLDAELRTLRAYLARVHFSEDFDYYDDGVQLYWKSDSPPPWPPHRSGSGISVNSFPTPPTIADLAAATHLDRTFLEEIASLLNDKQQLIFEGPPGSGKTFVAEKFARYFTGQPLEDPAPGETGEAAKPSGQIELVQFHQSYSYEDFVEGIRPRTNDAGQLVYDVEPGIFREFAERARINPGKKFVLVIDEINRGNVSRILGELMLLLEYRDKSARLPYSKEMLQIPPNLYIIGTMNSADRSLSQIDYALRRRFYFVRFMSVENGSADVLHGWLRANAPESMAALPLFIALNDKLRVHMGTDDLQVGHSYFMRTGIHTDAVQEQVWKYAVMPLLREYLYHHRDRDTLLQQYALATLVPSKELVGPDNEVDETQPDSV